MAKRIICTIVAIGFLLVAMAQQTLTKTMLHDAMSREYVLYIPAALPAGKAALVVNLHGYTSNNQQQMWYTNFNAVADTAGIIVCYPNGTFEAGTQNRFWNVGFSAATVNDEDFLIKLVDTIAASYAVDLNRVYFCGMSNGGFMSYAMACAYADRIAAIGSVTGSMTTAQGTSCPTNFSMPVMQIHGVMDPTVPYYGNAAMMSIEPLVKRWVLQNGCDTTPLITNVPNSNTTDGCTAVRYDYRNGTDGAEVAFYKIDSGQHTWPDGLITIATTNRDFNASVELWRFFLRHRANYTALPETTPDGDSFVMDNLITDFLTVASATPIHSIAVFDIQGNLVLSEKNISGLKKIAVSHLSKGFYFVRKNNENTAVKLLKW